MNLRIPAGRAGRGTATVLALLALVAVPPMTGRVRAEDLDVQVAGGDSLSLWVRLAWTRPLPSRVEDRLRRGIPTAVGFEVELWKVRSGWMDAGVARAIREVRIAWDPWREAYSLREGGHSETLDSLAGVIARISLQQFRVPVRRDWCDGITAYRVAVRTSVRPLTATDAGEVEDWAWGEGDKPGHGVLGLPLGLFDLVRDLSGLGERKTSASSPRFRMALLPQERLRVLLSGD